ncbi:MAG: hypothetical protein JST80_11085 [Bdellovibrionales bacterium]|nr:hypothetical protein [Bdellovibrionales bacterium]
MLRQLFSASLILFSLLTGITPAQADHPKTILLLHVGIGRGTTTAAEGIEMDLKERFPGTQVIVKDMLEYVNPVTTLVLKRGQRILARNFPDFYDSMYRHYLSLARSKESMGDMGLGGKFNAPKFLQDVAVIKPDAIVSCYHDATEFLIKQRELGNLKGIPVGWVHTDLVNETYFAKLALQVDMAFVGTPKLRNLWIDRGVPSNRVNASGLPINPSTKETRTDIELNQFRQKQGLKPDIRTILISGGSNGVGNFVAMIKALEVSMPDEELQIIAVCGRNNETYRKLDTLKPNLRHNINLLTTHMVPQEVLFNFMRISDLIISKSGGLTPMELFYQRKPLILLDNNGAQERYNAMEYEAADLAAVLRDEHKVGEKAKELFDNTELSNRLIENQIDFHKDHNPTEIADWIMGNPSIQPDLHKAIRISTEGDRPAPRGLAWKCARLFE